LYERAKASKDALNFRYYYTVHEQFRKSQQRFAKRQGGAPKPKRCLERIALPMEFGSFSEPTTWIHSNSENAPMFGGSGPDARAFRIHTPYDEITIPFEIVMDRPLPDGALIKGIALSGFHERPFEWKWSLVFSLQVPPHPKAPSLAASPASISDGAIWAIAFVLAC